MRAARIVLAVLALALAGSTSVRAADAIGGQLSAGGDHVAVRSDSTIPVIVTLTVTGAYSVAPSSFTLDPGETGTAKLSGSGDGTVSAFLQQVTALPGVDSATVTLQAGLRSAVVPAEPPYGLYGLSGLLGLLLALIVRRLRPWQWRITRVNSGQGLAEYALIISLIGIVAIVALLFLGSQISARLSVIGTTL